ncbi:hypothetical protein AYI70_g9584 [Smittium culicis]|uniref:Uncharacterized protein n=1 Tax=Smittium culicis TaxID=133412 RepID=A0A1R1XAJ8_9FUNG|nr:hypothetical protein AYI70_g9584 [Smittium culicis]
MALSSKIKEINNADIKGVSCATKNSPASSETDSLITINEAILTTGSIAILANSYHNKFIENLVPFVNDLDSYVDNFNQYVGKCLYLTDLVYITFQHTWEKIVRIIPLLSRSKYSNY